MKFPNLYGKSKNGKIKEWSIEVVDEGGGTFCVQSQHGYQDGKKQVHRRHVREGKNIGRSNETTPYEQACLEAASTHRSQKDSGYVEDLSLIPAPDAGLFLPMLAHRYDKQHAKIKFPCYVQPKLDGVRMLARREGDSVAMWSRMGKPIDIPDRINQQLLDVLEDGECTDGELYVHGWTFQRIVSAVKKKTPDTDLLEYHIYDSPHLDLTFEDRFVNPNRNLGPNVKLVVTETTNDQAEFDGAEQAFLTQGYEGMMARNFGSLYKFKHRSYDLQKVKRFIDSEYKIVGGKDGVGKEKGLIVWKCVTDKGLEFHVRPTGSADTRRDAFNNMNDYLGKMLTVQYQELTDDGVPRFPVGIAVRDYE